MQAWGDSAATGLGIGDAGDAGPGLLVFPRRGVHDTVGAGLGAIIVERWEKTRSPVNYGYELCVVFFLGDVEKNPSLLQDFSASGYQKTHIRSQ